MVADRRKHRCNLAGIVLSNNVPLRLSQFVQQYAENRRDNICVWRLEKYRPEKTVEVYRHLFVFHEQQAWMGDRATLSIEIFPSVT